MKLNSRIARAWAHPDRNSIWQSASIVTGLLSAILVARGSFFASPELIVKLSSPMWDSNPDVVRAWASQIAEAKTGLVLMVVSVVLSLPTVTRDTANIARNRVVGWIVGTIVAALLGLAAFAWADASANSLANRTFDQLSQRDSASRQTPDPNSATTQTTALAPTDVATDGTLWILADMDPNSLQAMAAIGTLLVTIILAVATWRYTAATKDLVAMQVNEAKAQAIPIVVVGLGRRNAPGAPFNYVARNVGRGAALNSFSLDSLEKDDAKVLVLGALPSGHQTLLPDEINDGLRRQPRTFDKDVYFIVAQPAVGIEWTASINRLDGNGRVSTEVMPWKPSDKLREKMRMQTLDEKLRAYYRANVRSEEEGA